MAKGSGGGGRSGRSGGGVAEYSSAPARYAKNSIAVSSSGDGGFANRAQMLAQGIGARYSGREKAYIMTRSQFNRFERLYKEGASGNVLGQATDSRGNVLPSRRRARRLF